MRARDSNRHLHAAAICYRSRHMNVPAKKLPASQAWKIEDALDLYQVEAWGKGYFSINADGHVVIRPRMDAAHEIDLYDVVQGLKARDLHTPVVIRFSDILAHRLRHLADAFSTAIVENDYRNRYAAVFPIKVNQQRLVVEEVYRYGKEFGFGLEVGSKPELLAVMSITEDAPDRIVVCNGFKDDSYIEAVILATKLGRTIIPIIENFEELRDRLKAQGYVFRTQTDTETIAHLVHAHWHGAADGDLLHAVQLAGEFPNARLILAHAGVCDLSWIWRAAPDLPNLLFDSAWWMPADLQTLFALVPAGQILFASDAPYGMTAMMW